MADITVTQGNDIPNIGGSNMLPGLIGGAFSAFSTLAQNKANRQEAEKNRRFQSAEAATARDFMQEMSSTSHQREVADLKAAGLNPILSVSKGASTPGAPAPSGSKADMSKAEVVAAASNAMDVKNKQETNKLIRAQVEQTLANAKQANAAADKTIAETFKIEFESTPYQVGNSMIEWVKKFAADNNVSVERVMDIGGEALFKKLPEAFVKQYKSGREWLAGHYNRMKDITQ